MEAEILEWSLTSYTADRYATGPTTVKMTMIQLLFDRVFQLPSVAT